MDFNIRRAVIGDEAILRSLRLQALTDSPSAFSTTYEREAARTTEDWQRWMSPSVTFLVEAGGQARGLVSGSHDADEPGVVLLRAMWVHPQLRGTGAARALVSSVKAWAVEGGASEVRLDVVENNLGARRCYERAGFRPTGRTGIVEKTGDVEVEMKCQGGALRDSAGVTG
jgi:RimJ/RimL family protein N-acetyltransferase